MKKRYVLIILFVLFLSIIAANKVKAEDSYPIGVMGYYYNNDVKFSYWKINNKYAFCLQAVNDDGEENTPILDDPYKYSRRAYSGDALCAIMESGYKPGDGATGYELAQVALWFANKTETTDFAYDNKQEALAVAAKCPQNTDKKWEPTINVKVTNPVLSGNNYTSTVTVTKGGTATSSNCSNIAVTLGTKTLTATDGVQTTNTSTGCTVTVPKTAVAAGGTLTVTATGSATGSRYYLDVYQSIKYGRVKQEVGIPGVESHTVTDQASGTTTVTPDSIDIMIYKRDRDGGTMITNTSKFRLYADSTCTTDAKFASNGQVIGEVISDNGYVYFRGVQKASSFSVKEITPPIGYQAPSSSNCTKLTMYSGIGIDNDKTTITVKKVDKDTKAVLQGAGFTLYTSESCSASSEAKSLITDKRYGELTTDTNGEVVFTGMASGNSYWVKETTPPTGYDALADSDNCKPVSLNGSITFENKKAEVIPESGTILVNKQDESGTKLNGAKFGLYTDQNCTTRARFVNGAITGIIESRDVELVNDNPLKGVAQWLNIPLTQNTYYVKEEQAPSGYSKDSTLCKPVTINKSVTFTNTKNFIQVIKLDSDTNAKLPGAVYELYTDNQCKTTSIATATSNSEGIARFEGFVNADNYYVLEKTPPKGYLEPTNNCKKATLNSTTNLEFKNSKMTCIIDTTDGQYYNDKGEKVTQEQYYEACNPKCEQQGGKYYDNTGKPVTEEEYNNSECNKSCKTEGNTYYDRDGKVVNSIEEQNRSCKKLCDPTETGYYDQTGKQYQTEEEMNRVCFGTCTNKNGKYYDGNGKVVTEEEYKASNCTPKCDIKDNKYYDKNGNVVEEDAYYKSCKDACSFDGTNYYDNNKNKVTEEEYKASSCTPKCDIKDGKYYNSNGNVVEEADYYKSCKNPCSFDGVNYYDKETKKVTEEEYKASSCTPKCQQDENKYYDDKGNVVTEEEYKASSCTPKCKQNKGQYYDDKGNVVTEDKYYQACNPKCEAANGKYYNKEGKEVTEAQYNQACNPKCEEKNGKYYNKNGQEVTQEQFKQSCSAVVVTAPDTSSVVSIALTSLGTALLGYSAYIVFRKYSLNK